MNKQQYGQQKWLVAHVLAQTEPSFNEVLPGSFIYNDSEVALSKCRFWHSKHESKLERRLLKRAQAGDKSARDQLLQLNLNFICDQARDRIECDFVDLVQVGACGFMHAVENFDTTKKQAKFSRYASLWINHYIQRYIDDRADLIRLPIQIHDNRRKVHRALTKLEVRLGREPNHDEIAAETNLKTAAVDDLLSYETDCGSIPQAVLQDDIAEVDCGSSDPLLLEKYVFEHQVHAFLDKMLQTLKPREQQILSLRAGLNEDGPHTLEEVGKALGLTRQRVRQIELKTLKTLKEKFADEVANFLDY